MCDIVISAEIGDTALSQAQAGRELTDPRVAVFYNLQQTIGWGPYQKLFILVPSEGIVFWTNYLEPLRTSILAYFLVYAGAPTTFYTDLQSAGIAITSTSIAGAEALFPNLSKVSISALNAVPTNASLNETIAFSVMASGGIPPYTYSWNFGDSIFDTAQNPTHSYTTAGNYQVKVTATDSNMVSATAQIAVTVNAPSNTGLAIVSVALAGAGLMFYLSNSV